MNCKNKSGRAIRKRFLAVKRDDLSAKRMDSNVVVAILKLLDIEVY